MNRRLKNAVHSEDLPPFFAAKLRDSVQTTNRLKVAAASEEVPPFLEAKIRNTIRATRRPRRWFIPVTALAGAAAALVIVFALGNLRSTAQSQESYIVSVSNHVATLMRVGLGDHLHCSVFRKYPKEAPTAEEFVKKMVPEYAPLIKVVSDAVPQRLNVSIAHECRYHGRKFVHISLRDGSNMISLVIAHKGDGESFKTEEMIPALVHSGIPIYQTGVEKYQVASFETEGSLVYVISDLGKEQNSRIMMAVAPQVKALLEGLDA